MKQTPMNGVFYETPMNAELELAVEKVHGLRPSDSRAVTSRAIVESLSIAGKQNTSGVCKTKKMSYSWHKCVSGSKRKFKYMSQ